MHNLLGTAFDNQFTAQTMIGQVAKKPLKNVHGSGSLSVNQL